MLGKEKKEGAIKLLRDDRIKLIAMKMHSMFQAVIRIFFI